MVEASALNRRLPGRVAGTRPSLVWSTHVCSIGYADPALWANQGPGCSQPLESRNSFRFLSGSMSSILVVHLSQSLFLPIGGRGKLGLRRKSKTMMDG